MVISVINEHLPTALLTSCQVFLGEGGIIFFEIRVLTTDLGNRAFCKTSKSLIFYHVINHNKISTFVISDRSFDFFHRYASGAATQGDSPIKVFGVEHQEFYPEQYS